MGGQRFSFQQLINSRYKRSTTSPSLETRFSNSKKRSKVLRRFEVIFPVVCCLLSVVFSPSQRNVQKSYDVLKISFYIFHSTFLHFSISPFPCRLLSVVCSPSQKKRSKVVRRFEVIFPVVCCLLSVVFSPSQKKRSKVVRRFEVIFLWSVVCCLFSFS